MSSTATPPEAGLSGAALHWRALEGLYSSAPINQLFASKLTITGDGQSRIEFIVDESCYHAAGAARAAKPPLGGLDKKRPPEGGQAPHLSERGAEETVQARRRRRAMKPSAIRPVASMATLAGSGTAVMTRM